MSSYCSPVGFSSFWSLMCLTLDSLICVMPPGVVYASDTRFRIGSLKVLQLSLVEIQRSKIWFLAVNLAEDVVLVKTSSMLIVIVCFM